MSNVATCNLIITDTVLWALWASQFVSQGNILPKQEYLEKNVNGLSPMIFTNLWVRMGGGSTPQYQILYFSPF